MRPGWLRMKRMLSAFLIVASLAPGSSAVELSESEFHRLHKQLQSAPVEPWQTIPWQTSVLDAQRIAVRDNKPIFIWAMDGHPLGCT